MTKPTILFFARGYQADFFPTLSDARYDARFVTLTEAEAAVVRQRGQSVAACFEADYAGIEPAKVPPDYLLTSSMSDRFLGRFDDRRRHEVLGKEIAFWGSLLDRLKPAAVVNELIAIEISEVLLIECRRRGIPYLAGMNCVVDDLFYWLADPLTLSGTRLSLPAPGSAALAEADRYLETLSASDYRPFYVQNLAGRRALKPLAIAGAKMLLWWWRGWRDRHGAPFRYEMYGEEYSKKVAVFGRSFTTRYDSLDQIPPDREVIFYPLHQEPEATLNYMSEFYANQVATIENILKCLRSDQVLVVKEHPVDKGALLRGKFRTLKDNCSALYFLPAEVHGRAVLARASRVVTLTSTVGWEAAVLGFPVYLLGEIWYDDLPGINRPSGFPELERMLHLPAADAERLDRDDARQFIAALIEHSLPGNPFPHAGLYGAQNLRRIADAVCLGAGIDDVAARVPAGTARIPA